MVLPTKSKLDANQVLQHAFDDSTGTLRTTALLNAGGTSEIIISHADDSIKIGDGTNLATITQVSSKYGLDANVINTVPVLQSGTWNINNISGTISLPTGAATSANQTTTNTSLASIDTKTLSPVSSTANITRVSSSATTIQLIAANSSRLGLILVNDSTQNCYVKFGTTASSTSYTYLMTSNSTVILNSPIYTGRIDAIWASANGAMQITELV